MREFVILSFTQPVLSAPGGLASESTIFYKQLAACVAKKNGSNCTLLPWPGGVATLTFLYSDQQYNVSVVPNQALVMHLNLFLPLILVTSELQMV